MTTNGSRFTAPYRFQGNKLWCAASQPHHRLVAVKIRLYNDHFVAGVDVAEDGGEQGFIGSISHQHLLVGVNLVADVE